jgi:hypothetical protein
MTRKILLGVSALALVAGLSVSAVHANPTAKQNDYNVGSAIGNVANSVGVGIWQDASADGGAYASASDNAGSWADAWAGGYGGDAGVNHAAVHVKVETDNVALVSENELSATVSNYGSVYADGGWHASVSTGSAKQNDSQQMMAAGLFNNDLSTGLGSGQQQGNSVGVNASSINF